MNPGLKKFYEADRPLLKKKVNADDRNSVFIASIPNMDDASSIYKTKTNGYFIPTNLLFIVFV